MKSIHISSLKDLSLLHRYAHTQVFGVWVTAFMRIIPAFLLKDKFRIICYKNSLDLNIIKKDTDVFCLQQQKNWSTIDKLNTQSILQHPKTREYCKKHPKSSLFVYKSNSDIEKEANTLWYTILNNISVIRDVFENKKEFRTILAAIGIPPIPWENILLTTFQKKKYAYFQRKYWTKFVIQLPDITNWWGLWTFFIHDSEGFIAFQKRISSWTYKNKIIHSINITTFINGTSSSIIWCATKYGTLSSSIQTQLIDIPEAIHLKKWSWLFCGHDRSYKHFSQSIQKQASSIAEKLWTYMYKHWYKGIFWLDLLIDEQQDKIYVVECNARYTWAFPMISLLDIQKWVPPMDTFHLLEHMNIPYTVDFKKINKQYKYKKKGSHIILSNKEEQEIVCKKDLLPGVYTFKGNHLSYKRPGIWYSDLKQSDEFIIIDGNPKKWEKIRAFNELSRFCHLLFPGKIATTENTLTKKTKNIINHIYTTFIS